MRIRLHNTGKLKRFIVWGMKSTSEEKYYELRRVYPTLWFDKVLDIYVGEWGH